MKHFIATLTLAFALISFSSFTDEGKVSPAVLESFKTSFKNATEVDWSVKDNFYKATFSMNGQYVTAFYATEDAHLVALTRNITSTQLPINLQANLKKEYDNMWISDLFELANEGGTSYYITLENADTRLVLKSNSTDWTTFQKQRKS